MAGSNESFSRELSRINEVNLINIIINKYVPENVVVSGELRNHIETDKFMKNWDSCAFQGASHLNLKTSIDNIRLESDLKVMKAQLDCAMEIMSNLKKSITDKQTITDILTKSRE
ncbi:hypothetical protein HHI36_001529 [Cryptolaemus montrouzieri]|uniref:BLOC-1-related complex subunit 7 n=1 Tax=Cryptolaemus montrouzieri TaxID=559131 RepID=A0ABD2P7W6_9CUCU